MIPRRPRLGVAETEAGTQAPEGPDGANSLTTEGVGAARRQGAETPVSTHAAPSHQRPERRDKR
jgi:hypothetical protein